MAEVTRKTVLALTEETTRATPVVPSGATDFTALQEDASMVPNFEELENAELSNSIGQKQVVLGLERPEMSFSHYMRHSGVEGTAPDYHLILKSLFGKETVNGTQYDTVAGATAGSSTARATIDTDTAEGATFARGQALLIKDATNSYSVRNIYSIGSDTLTLPFNLAAAPAAGVNLGKCVAYSPADDDEDYPTLSGWKYNGNGGAIEMISGLRTTGMTVDITAGQMINGAFTFSGIEYFFNPITVTASNKYIDLTDDGGTILLTLTEDTYKDPNDLAAHIQTVGAAAVAASGGDDFLCTYSSSTGKFTISTTTGTTFSLLWKTGTKGSDNTDTHAGTLLGFSDVADDTAGTSYTSDTAMSWAAGYTPTLDSENPVVAKDIEAMWGDYDEYACKAASKITINVSNEQADVPSICATSGRSDTVFTRRTVTIDTTMLLTRHEADTFTRYRENTSIPFACTWGRKSGGNWAAGSVGNVYIPDATVTKFEVSDENGLIVLNLSLRAYVGSGQTEEVYLNFL